ncbi:hypothetical protein ACH5RR_041792, partial [Cinchona calisaya]
IMERKTGEIQNSSTIYGTLLNYNIMIFWSIDAIYDTLLAFNFMKLRVERNYSGFLSAKYCIECSGRLVFPNVIQRTRNGRWKDALLRKRNNDGARIND